ncbi:MAG: Tat pathway signal protein, partial [Raoultibacter sp.]
TGGSTPLTQRRTPHKHTRPVAKRTVNTRAPRGTSQPGIHIPTNNGEILLTRRHFLYGALGVGVLAAAAAGGSALQSATEKRDTITYLEVPEQAVFSLADCSEIPLDQALQLTGSYEFPYGTLIWSNNDTNAACLLPTETANPLVHVGIITLASGEATTVLEAAVGQAEGFEVYDVRASEAGLVWTEANILEGLWRVYGAPLAGLVLGAPTLLDQGDEQWEAPSIAAVGAAAFWQCLPKAKGAAATENSLLKRADFGGGQASVLYTSSGRMSTPIYPLADSVVITPRVDTNNVYHQLTRIKASDGSTMDALVLPPAMKPLEAGYGATGFTFSFEGRYNYGDGIANLGTYAPQTAHDPENYQGLPWFHFDKVPSAPPAWCGNFFMVKSTRAVSGVDLANKTYFSCGTESGCEDWGDYLASTGTNTHIITFMNINMTTTAGEAKKLCRVRTWAPLA